MKFALAIVLVLFASPAFADRADVRTFGATGDGITNDAPAIQSAIDAAANAGGGTVYLPAGMYLLQGRSLMLESGVTVEGERGTVLRADSGGVLLACAGSITGASVYNCEFQGTGSGTAIELRGSTLTASCNQISGFATGISILGESRNIVVKANWIEDVAAGVSLSTWEGATLQNVTVERNVIVLRPTSSGAGVGYGSLASFTTAPVALAIRDNVIYADGTISGVPSYAAGVRLARGEDVQIVSNTIYNLPGRGIDLYGDMQSVWVRNNYIADVGQGSNPVNPKTPRAFAQGIAAQMTNAWNVVIVGNTVRNDRTATIQTGILVAGTIDGFNLVNNTVQAAKAIDDRRAK